MGGIPLRNYRTHIASDYESLTGTLTRMLVPRPGAVRMSKEPFSLFTLARMFANPNPSLLSASVVIPGSIVFYFENQVRWIRAQTDADGR